MDVFAQDSAISVRSERKFTQIPPRNSTNQVEESYRPGDNTWLPTSGRARVLVYSPERVKTEDLPKTLSELANPHSRNGFGHPEMVLFKRM